MKQLFLSVLAAICATLVSGCALRGPLYADAQNSGALAVPTGKSLVLIYWTPGFAGGGQRVIVYANDQRITTKDSMRRGAFCSYSAEPGELRLSSTPGSGNTAKDVAVLTAIGGIVGLTYAATTQKSDRVLLTVAPGETYYVEMYLGPWREEMRVVSKADGENGIRNCRWLNPPP